MRSRWSACSAHRCSSGCSSKRTSAAAAFGLLAVLGATDWVDGWIARRFDQGSELGKVLDPIADRILLLTAAVALTVDGVVPTWVGVVVLVREAVVSVATLGARRAPAPAGSTCSGPARRARSR